MNGLYRDLPRNLLLYFTEEQPFGPPDAAAVKDEDVSAYLLYPASNAFQELISGATLLLGRRGAGKSSIIRSFATATLTKRHFSAHFPRTDMLTLIDSSNELTKKYDLTVDINMPKEINGVYDDIRHFAVFTPEIASDAWDRALWRHVAFALCNNNSLRERLPKASQAYFRELGKVIHANPTESDNIGMLVRKLSGPDAPTPEEVVAKAKFATKEAKFETLFLLDSMEEYDINDEKLRKIVAGLLQYSSTYSGPNDGVTLKVSLPSEFYPRIKHEANPEKYAVRMEPINWRPIELLRVVTHRFLTGLKVLEPQSFEQFYDDYGVAWLTSRDRLFALWNRVFDGVVVNEGGHNEQGIYFLLRHTQMLPRQMINFISLLAKASRVRTRPHGAAPRTYSSVNRAVMEEAVRGAADNVISGVASGYKFVFPRVLDALGPFLRRCAIRMAFGQLHATYTSSATRAFGEEYAQSFEKYLQMLMELGIFGTLEQETDYYLEGSFAYNDGMPHYNEKSIFVMHPAFSANYLSKAKRIEPQKAVLPRGSFSELSA